MGRTIAERREWENYSNVVVEPKAVEIVLSEFVSCLLSVLFLKIYKINIDTQSDPAAQASQIDSIGVVPDVQCIIF